MQTAVAEQLEGLIADLGEPHVGDSPRGRPTLVAGGLVDEGNDRVDHDHQVRARLDGNVEVGGGDDAAVDQLAIADLDGRVDHGQGAGGAHGG